MLLDGKQLLRTETLRIQGLYSLNRQCRNDVCILNINIRRFIMGTSIPVVNEYSLLMYCIKIKSPAKFLFDEQYVFVGGNISFLCVLSCSSEEA